MPQATFSIRMDENLKRQFDELCNEFGMTATTAFNVFARAVVREKKIPFEIKASDDSLQEEAKNAFYALRETAKENGVQDLRLSEINKEIQEARKNKEVDQ
ncbi:MAG TPA: type II toxin-antitoxin system RelB/DinJ family antitoxin [Candidatus Dorea merdavium]|nr:type II toxin-antitoxin system RelB/DinJ family antitoxin [Candidatus Dorea merdavium]